MDFSTKNIEYTLRALNSNMENGLDENSVQKNTKEYGLNQLTKKGKTPFIKKLIQSLEEPMIIILLFSFVVAFGISIGEFIKTKKSDFTESIGILLAITISISITLIMEGSSEKAFRELGKIYQDILVKVIRGGEILLVKREFITVGDIVFLETGDKIIADGRLVETNDLCVDESALTGESNLVKKDEKIVLNSGLALAEKINIVYSGTFVASGSGKMVVTAIGDKTEIGGIAEELKNKREISSPLNQKLNKLSKIITIIGVICAVAVFTLSLIRLIISGEVTFSHIQNLFVNCIVLIVAAVPEGLPTIVAVSLALNMIKLARENALIKKMMATETTGAVSVICSDKTGTLTLNKMTVSSICNGDMCMPLKELKEEVLIQNFVCNSTADVLIKSDGLIYQGSGTECALISMLIKGNKNFNYRKYRNQYKVIDREPFSSDKKYMTTTIKTPNGNRLLVKGAPERVLEFCNLTLSQREKIDRAITEKQKLSGRVICFCHNDGEGFIYDGFAVLKDGIRRDVYKAVKDCKRAGIKIKVLTGDNRNTAYAVARELDIAIDESQVVNATDVERLDDESLKKLLPKITVIARSTPLIKLRVVKLLKSMGEVVAVTGDGINDAPAIKHADVGIAMGKSGNEITRESADIVLLDDSFSTIVKAIAFGRNVYRNLQKFIMFQLSVNVSALLFIVISTILGFDSPFNTLQLLWINVIMDGPPALTLGLGKSGNISMSAKPVKRSDSIVSKTMLIRIIISGLIVAILLALEYKYDYLNVGEKEMRGVIFTMFILFQLFNAFNSIELGGDSIIKSLGDNKIMLISFALVFLAQVLIVQVFNGIFNVDAISFASWIKCILISSTIIVGTEFYKLIYRIIKRKGLIDVQKIKNISFGK